MTNQNLFRISTGGFFGLINDHGDIVIEPKFTGLGDVRSEGIVATKDGTRYGVIDESGKFVIKPTFESLGSFFSCDLLAAKKNKFGYIFSDGKTAIDFKFRSASHFFEDRAAVEDASGYYFVNKNGDPLNSERYKRVRFFSCLRGGVIIDQRLGFIDADGILAVSPKYDALLSSNFQNNYSSVVAQEMWGIIDQQGVYVVPSEFAFAGDVSQEAIAAIQSMDGKWGYVNVGTFAQSGQQFDFAGKFLSGRAIVKLDQRCCLIDESFQILKNIDCDKVINIASVYMIIESHGLEGAIDIEGNIIIPCRYDQVKWSKGEIFEFVDGNSWGYVTSKGREIWRSQEI